MNKMDIIDKKVIKLFEPLEIGHKKGNYKEKR